MVDVVKTQLIPGQGREEITVMDDYGTAHIVYVAVGNAKNRDALVAAAVAQQTENETALEAYATAHKIDLSAKKAAGLAKKQTTKGTK